MWLWLDERVAKWSRKAEIAEELQGLALTAEEGFVLSRLDTALTREQVGELTGLSAERLDHILALLEDKGLVVSDTPSMRPSMATIPDGDFDSEALQPTPSPPVAAAEAAEVAEPAESPAPRSTMSP